MKNNVSERHKIANQRKNEAKKVVLEQYGTIEILLLLILTMVIESHIGDGL